MREPVLESAFGGPKYPIAIALNSVIGVIATLMNLFILLLFIQQRKTRDISHKFVISMALADLMEGLFGAPLTSVMASGLTSGPFLCLITLTIKITIHMLTVFCVVMTSLDRFWAIMAPFHHRYHRTGTFASSKYKPNCMRNSDRAFKFFSYGCTKLGYTNYNGDNRI